MIAFKFFIQLNNGEWEKAVTYAKNEKIARKNVCNLFYVDDSQLYIA